MAKIFPEIDFHEGHNEKIELFLGPVPPLASAYFSGWGCHRLEGL